MMNLQEWNAEQIKEALSLGNRLEYSKQVSEELPTETQLVLFYIEQHAPEFQQLHQDELDFG